MAYLGEAARSGPSSNERELLQARYRDVRAASAAICAPLTIEHRFAQPIPDVSPPKWYLASTTWFSGAFVLGPFQPGYQPFHPAFDGLFNSYYLTHGSPCPRPQRGHLTRPSVDEVRPHRRVQRQVHVRPDGAARRQLRHLPQVLLSQRSLAVLRHPPGDDR